MLITSLTFKPLGLSYFAQFNVYGVSDDTKYTNNTNERMNSENNQTQIDLWNQQKEYDYQMWKENNAYNTPSAQVQRLKDAGLNPALAMNQINTGTSTASAGGQTLPTTTAAHAENPANEVVAKTQNIALIGKQLSDISKQYQESEALQMQNAWTNTKNALEVGERTRNLKLQDEAIYSARRLNQFNDEVFSARQMQEEEKANVLFQQRLGQSVNNAMSQIELDIKEYYHNNIQPQELDRIKAEVQDTLTHAVVQVFDAKTNRMNANTNQYKAKTDRLQYLENIRVDDHSIKEIDSRIANSDADTATKKFWNDLNDENKRWIVTKIVSDAKNTSLDPLFKSLQAITGGFGVFMK